MKIFINGFGRIGRTVARIILEQDGVDLAGINDIVDSPQNLAYLLKYDSVYGRLNSDVFASGAQNQLQIGGQAIPVFSQKSMTDIDWGALDVDIIIDSSGVQSNVDCAARLSALSGLKGVVITHAPSSGIDRTIIMGVNESDYRPMTDFVVSSSICDANAIAHPLKMVEEQFGIETGSVTTMHPWLAYQNLTDSAVAGQSDPGHFWPDYSLGRSSVGALIPKNTTAVKALRPVLPNLTDRLSSFSYRIPTSVVTSADLTLVCKRPVSQKALVDAFTNTFTGSRYVGLNYESLVSVDYERSPYSATIDMQWLEAGAGNLAKIIVWYDNEWGYAQRALDTARLMVSKKGNAS